MPLARLKPVALLTGSLLVLSGIVVGAGRLGWTWGLAAGMAREQEARQAAAIAQARLEEVQQAEDPITRSRIEFGIERGKMKARNDIAIGRLCILRVRPTLGSCILRAQWTYESDRILRSKYGIAIESTDEYSDVVNGYNEVMEGEIAAQRGADFFHHVEMEAKRNVELKSRAPASPSSSPRNAGTTG